MNRIRYYLGFIIWYFLVISCQNHKPCNDVHLFDDLSVIKISQLKNIEVINCGGYFENAKIIRFVLPDKEVNNLLENHNDKFMKYDSVIVGGGTNFSEHDLLIHDFKSYFRKTPIGKEMSFFYKKELKKNSWICYILDASTNDLYGVVQY